MKIVINKADKWFSKCIRQAANWVCQNCGIDKSEDRGDLHCSHFVGRNAKMTRYHPLNAFAHCKSCHGELGGNQHQTGNPAEFAYHYDSINGASNREFMRVLSKYPMRNHEWHVDEISDYYRNIYNQIKNIDNAELIRFDFWAGSNEVNAIVKTVLSDLKR